MHGHVTLISCSPEAAAIIASGGRISTMDGTADEIYAKSLAAGQEKNEKLIGKVLSSGHTSVLEHCYVNLSFENVSVLAEQFLIEFRLASFTVKSRRYVDFSGAGYVAPDFSDPAQAAAFDAAVRALFGIYDELEAAGVPKEDARFVLPYCFCSNFFCSMNARELVHVMNELTYGRGSGIPELRALGESLFAQCEARLPFLALRKPEVYRRTPDWTPQAAQPLVPDAPVTVLSAAQDAGRKICDAYLLARGLAPQPLREDEQTKLLKTLLARPRRRELEQASYTLLFGGPSLAALTHLTRHRMQSLCPPQLLQNIRYDRYVLPQSVRDKGMEARYRSAFELAGQAAAQLRDRGADESALCYLMLSGQTVPVLTTMNAGELYVFFRLRCCTRAQWEIRDAACQALAALREVSPELFRLYGPTCFCTGKCPEGKMTCGRQAEMKRKFSE